MIFPGVVHLFSVSFFPPNPLFPIKQIFVGRISNRLRSLRAQGNTQFSVNFVYLYYFYIKNDLGCYSVFYIELCIIFLLFYDFFRFTSRTSLTDTLSPNQEHLFCNLFAVYLIL